jgi:acyl-CoA reductase-like NAD-dependent aldehyde dehydrogenase
LRIPWQTYGPPSLKGVLPTPIFDLIVGTVLGVYSSMNHIHRTANYRSELEAMPKLTAASTSCNDETPIHAIRDLFRAQRLASRTVPTLTIKQRVKSLNTIRALILNNGAAIQKSICNDFGNRSTAETEMLEMIPVLNAIRYTRRNLGAWMRPEVRPGSVMNRWES